MKRTPHLTAGFISVTILVAAMLGFNYYAESLEASYINALGPLDLAQTRNGSALQRAAIQQPDLLSVYGSSEITMIATNYQANLFFSTYPTGFTTIDIANLGMSSITMAQNLAALGPALKGKKVVISITPAPFTMGALSEQYYAGNYTRLHAYEMIFSPYLSMDTKSAAAKRMLEFPFTLQADPFLKLTLSALNKPSLPTKMFYYIAWPLGELQTIVMNLQDHAAVIAYLRSHSINPDVQREPRAIDWSATLETALAEQKMHTLNNSYGVEDTKWKNYQGLLATPIVPGSGDKRFIRDVQGAREWDDLQILLSVLQELGAQPLILSRPMNVHLWEALGVSEKAQNTFYTKLHDVTAPYNVQVVDYREYGTDIYFSIDQAAHTSREGWVYVDQTLDDFFHGRLH
ncbi:MAG: D-alanyl-lipoteichoic acid biosynthesis protein DltD [Chloroflexi bacterium]|nr:D-alanyl-lipoteichoic acid biosynthesis protein DltD [Chloroflexota bacterium]